MEDIITPQQQEEHTTEPVKKDKKDKKPSAADFASLSVKLKNASDEAQQAKDTLLRTAAEYDNYRKRSAKEKEESFSNGVSSSVAKLLPVLDTLELAANATCTDDEYKKGVTMTLSKCAEAFKSLGIEEISALNEQFNPELHCAVMQQESEEESGTIVNVFQKGYTLNGKVVRHTSVAVSE